jgi:phosphoribosylformimino-5-aminoimidazole carboxamide ribotide isomerase
MIAIPAVEVRGGATVQLAGSARGDDQVSMDDATRVARGWSQLGFRRLHVVDLDAATGSGSNFGILQEILRDASAEVQVGGGIRSTDGIEQLFRAGANRVVVGTRAIEDPDWLGDVAALYPGVIVVATDVRGRRVVTRGWVRTLPVDVLDIVQDLNAHPLGGVLVTELDLEGGMRATDLALLEDVAESSRFPVIAAGGVATLNDLRALEHRGIDAVILGSALYSGALDPRAVAQEFGDPL